MVGGLKIVSRLRPRVNLEVAGKRTITMSADFSITFSGISVK